MKSRYKKICVTYLICAFCTCLMIRYMLFSGFETGGYNNSSYRALNINHTKEDVKPFR